MSIKIIRDYKECSRYISDMIGGEAPSFLSRVGGSDTAAIAAYVATGLGSTDRQGFIAGHRNVVEKYNGFYDKTIDNDGTFLRYLDILLECYRRANTAFVVGADLFTLIYPEKMPNTKLHEETEKVYTAFLNAIDGEEEKILMSYEYAESMTWGEDNLFNMFSLYLKNKKVLVVSPFTESIRSNFPNRHKFFKSYDYPDFELLTCDSPITYAGLPLHHYPDANWIETAHRLEHEISQIDFDIALLCCGSYAMPLGVAIAEKMKRKAIYLGGVTQMYFGVMGRRYETTFFMNQINAEHFVRPIEADKFKAHIITAPGAETEAFGAYF